jgi:hypothetical protein
LGEGFKQIIGVSFCQVGLLTLFKVVYEGTEFQVALSAVLSLFVLPSSFVDVERKSESNGMIS